MKKNILCALLIVIVLLIFTTASFAVESPPGTVPSEPIMTTVVPLKYDPIESINGDLFITNKDLLYTLKPKKNLYNFAGDLLLEGMQDISFSGNWIIVRQGGKLGVYSHELVNLVPCLYSRVVMTDETHCEVVDGTKYVKPGTWFGNRYRCDLTTGTITEKLGYGMEAFPSWSLVSLEKRLADAGGLAGISLMRIGGKLNKYGSEAGVAYKAYNGFGQLLLDFTPYCGTGSNHLAFGNAGRLFIGYADDGNDSQGALNYAFSGRGRLIARQRGARFDGVYGGNYIAYGNNTVLGTKPFLVNWDGETVIAEGVYDNYSLNTIASDTWTTISDNSSHIIVSKDGLYGVISLPEYVPKPSSWAQAAVMLARTAAFLKIQATGTEIVFADESQFPKWAAGEITTVSSILTRAGETPLIQGSGNNLFSAKRCITVEQTAAAMFRLTEAVR